MVVKALFLAFLQGFGVKKPFFYPNLYKNCPPLNLKWEGGTKQELENNDSYRNSSNDDATRPKIQTSSPEYFQNAE